MKVGDRVMYSRKFCRSVGLLASNDPLVHRRQGGEVTAFVPMGRSSIATVLDANGDERRVLATNLVLTTARELA